MSTCFPTYKHDVDFCVVGGGLSGLLAAVAAARHGAKVALMQDRPMLGGNASSEIRMWICGAHGPNMRETGILEELNLNNHYRNPDKNYSVWDGILHELAISTPNLEMMYNCSCCDCGMDDSGKRIEWIRGWQTTTQQWHEVRAKIFADCSGDSILAPLTGAEYRYGRESRDEFDEPPMPEVADRRTMGMSCLMQARQEDRPSEFIPPAWAHKYTADDLPHRTPNMTHMGENFWYIELGGEYDAIGDTEKLRDELLKITCGIWDYVKNAPENKARNANWRLDWVGMLPGKRESRRYVGDHILCANEIRDGGHFDDLIAYGGWTMDNHHPAGFATDQPPTIYHPAPSPFGIPYRCLYSKNIDNLMFAGRNISVTHMACSACRVMATCGLLGQAAGTAAAIAVEKGLTPRGVYEREINLLKQTLMDDDCYLPFNTRQVSELCKSAELICKADNAESLRSGVDRPIGSDTNRCAVSKGEVIEYRWTEPRRISSVRITFDSDFNCETLPPYEQVMQRGMLANRPLNLPDTYVPKTIVRAYRIDAVKSNGETVTLVEVDDNHQRLCKHNVSVEALAVRLIPLDTWGSEVCGLFAFDVA
ncbi:hypothetical protein AGMMS49992_12310 [Clostridia bacterium]|nr:hypothetical protein AGMMS49992_12310 [Clostridia bacterium]